ncbi:MAG TPA: hypothetical protein VK454_05435 [Myxococcaceae bacterium]|nr:hypothetical protein [Myxococcaceae bacterium]
MDYMPYEGGRQHAGKESQRSVVAAALGAALLLGVSVLARPLIVTETGRLGQAAQVTQQTQDERSTEGDPGAGVAESELAILPK